MKILHVIPGVSPKNGGPTKAVYGMCGALNKNNQKAYIATTNADGNDVLPVPLGEFVNHNNVPTIFFHRHWSEAFKYSWTLGRWLHQNISNYDIVHIHAIFSYSSIAAAKACHLHDVPYIVRPLGSLDPWSLRQRKFLKNILWWLFVRKMLSKANAIHYTTNEERRLAENHLDLNSGVVIPLGLDRKIFSSAQHKSNLNNFFPDLLDKPYVLILSRIDPKKRIKPFIDVFERVTERRNLNEWQLVIAGDDEGKYFDSVKSHANNSKVADRIVFTGWVDGEEKIALLQHADLSALPSYQENFGFSVIEAMAFGVPVLISNRVNIAKEVRNVRAGWVTSLEDESISSSLIDAIENEQERNKRGLSGKELVKSKYTWSSVGNELIKLYRSIVF